MPKIDIKCPNARCGFAGRVNETRLGTRVVCYRCGTAFLVTHDGAKDVRLPEPGDGGTPLIAAKPTVERTGQQDDGSVLILSGDVRMEFVSIPPGTFLMGSPETEEGRNANEGPQHQVTIAYPFWLGKYPVTQAQWQAVMGTGVADKRDEILRRQSTVLLRSLGMMGVEFGTGPDHPMYFNSWYESQEFVQKVNAMGQGTYRLPSEAEWEYACRAGAQTQYNFGDNAGQLGEHAWYVANNGRAIHPVGQKVPNAWGLYDMHGNVSEWCQDWWHDSYNGAPTDGSAWESPAGQGRVWRGGVWQSGPLGCRSAYRNSSTPDSRSFDYGFRLLRT